MVEQNKQYIHYCWFGGKKLPKLAKKCIKSWQKYLPDFEIKRWDESNCNLHECPFVEQLYQQKKWAFVSDYFRTKALKEHGGIYLDTDMEVTSSIDDLLSKSTSFLGIEDTGYVAVGVWYEKFPQSELTTTLLNKYQKFKEVKISDLANLSIPRLISECLKKYQIKASNNKIQKLKNGMIIYPREYFYPLSYGHDFNQFTKNTRMIHHYDASWIGRKDKIELYLVRKVGRRRTLLIEKWYFKTKHFIIILAKIILFPIVIYRRLSYFLHKRKERPAGYQERLTRTITKIKDHQGDIVVFMNTDWLGTANATQEIFPNAIDCGEIFGHQDINRIRDAILSIGVNQVIFSAFAIGWAELAKALKNKKPSIKLKVYWHGSNSQITDTYGWQRNQEIIDLLRHQKLDAMASCKKSLVEFYNGIGFNNVVFLTNKVRQPNLSPVKKDRKIRLGIYAAQCTNWRKNMFSQIAAAAQIPGAVIDMAPLDPIAERFAKEIGAKISGVDHSLSRRELLSRMAKNSVNLYVTFSECAPMLPLESLSVDVPCLTGNNHHYFKDTELEKYLVIDNECDIQGIKAKIELCLKHRDKILRLYQNFNHENSRLLNNNLKDFLEI